MARRSRSREVALQLLFQRDQNAIIVPRKAIEKFTRDRLRDPDLVTFCLALYDGVVAHQPMIDKLISETAENWRLTRMMPADRNVLRLGTFELLHSPDQSPPAIILNEAIELARRFGTADSPSFANGILDKIAKKRAAMPEVAGESVAAQNETK
ncbi:transcription antitermination factor NusB [Fimbriiglobus ruber]|uniref:Transcription antitermination protein NusB n=1 Tax=Fimbriiglobus ruber TaxID=1908690 RepID=A0A225DBV0_9BACT|nr:transcription antitermination factor NusB [Fimbriiglobus ruber]OWK34776.1 Transcription termination protein NusB [Fimbriiglobus ruber]